MGPLKEFTIPLKGLKPGLHQYHFEVDHRFFKNFDKPPIDEGMFKVDLEVDRSTDLFTVKFKIEGKYSCSCDRCLAPIELPVEHEDQVILKFEEGVDDDQVNYLDPQASEWNAAQVIFEMICMAMPLNNVYDCDGKVCDQEVLRKLEKIEGSEVENKSIWEDLKNIKLN